MIVKHIDFGLGRIRPPITVSATAAQNVKERISLQSKKEKMEKPICCMEWLLRVPLRG